MLQAFAINLSIAHVCTHSFNSGNSKKLYRPFVNKMNACNLLEILKTYCNRTLGKNKQRVYAYMKGYTINVAHIYQVLLMIETTFLKVNTPLQLIDTRTPIECHPNVIVYI